MRNHLKEILFALTDAGVAYVIGGGVAAVLHGVERVTLDLDLAVEMTPENLARFSSVMKQLRLRPRVPVPVEFLAVPANVRTLIVEKNAMVFSFIDVDDPLRYVDIFLKDNLSYPVLMLDAITVEMDNRRIQVVGLRRLLSLKKSIQPPRDKDVMDIRALEKMIKDEAV